MPRLAVLGHPVAHSRSPAMHGAALEKLGLAPEWSYEAIAVSPDGFEELVRSLPGSGFVGANVTVPHKGAALALASRASPAAREIGAANTLSFAADGAIAADNTDAPALIAAVPAAPGGRRALVLGAGGSARAVVWALVDAGAAVTIWNRTPERAEELAARLGGTAIAAQGIPVAGDFELIVNCTVVGMGNTGPGLDALPMDADEIEPGHVVVDLAYGDAETQLCAAARARGATVVDGLEVLARQGALSLEIWTGRRAPLDVMRAAVRHA